MTVRTQRALKSLSKVIDSIDRNALIEQATLVPHIGPRLVTTLESYGVERIKSDIADMLNSPAKAAPSTSCPAKKSKVEAKAQKLVEFTTRRSTWDADFKAVGIDLDHREKIEKELLSSVKAASRRANRFTCIKRFGKALDRDHVATVTVDKGSITVVYGKMSALGYCITRGRATFII